MKTLIIEWKNSLKICLVTLSITGLCSSAIFANEFQNEFDTECVKGLVGEQLSQPQAPLANKSVTDSTWTPDLSSTQGKLSFISSVLSKHPTLVRENLQFRRSLLNTVEPVSELIKALGPNASSLEMAPTKRLGMHYLSTGQELQYDSQKINELKNNLRTDIDKLEISQVSTIQDHLDFLKEQARKKGPKGDKYFKQQLKILFRVSPFLYDGEGKAIFADISLVKNQAKQKIQDTEPQMFENFFKDQVIYHLKPVFIAHSKKRGFGSIKDLFESSFEKEFLRKTLRQALEQKTNQNTDVVATQRQLSIEEMPPAVSLFRGCFGGDCSILSVPNYGLVKGTKVYWIRKSMDFNESPDGYVFVAEGKINEKTVPYIITINGATLTEADARAVIKLVAHDFNSSEVIYPDLNKNQALVNWQQMKHAMTDPSAKLVSVNLPQGWSAIGDKTTRPPGYSDYYAEGNLKNGYLSKVERPKNIAEFENTQGYKQSSIEEISKLDRALLAVQSFMHDKQSSSVKRDEVLKLLQVTEQDLNAAKPILEASKDKPLTLAEYQKAHEVLDFNSEDLLKLDPITKAHSIGNLYHEKPDLFDAKTWKRLMTQADRKLTKDVSMTGTVKSIHNDFAVIAVEGRPEIKLLRSLVLDGKWEVGSQIRVLDVEKLTENNQVLNTVLSGRVALLKDYLPPKVLFMHFKEVRNSLKNKSQLEIAANVEHSMVDRMVLGKNDTEEFIQFQKLAAKKDNDLVDLYIHRLGPERIARDLLKAFQSDQQQVRDFGEKILEKLDPFKYEFAEVYKELIAFQEQTNVPFKQVIRMYLESTDRAPEKKALLVLTQVGVKGSEFNEYLNKIPKTEQSKVWNAIDGRTSIGFFLTLAKKQGLETFVLENGKLESFVLKEIPKGDHEIGEPLTKVTLTRSDAIGATVVTQLQYALVMGESPSHFKGDSVKVVINGKEVEVSNRPVENLNYEQAVQYFKRMSELDPKYNWDLPTEAQWEVAARAGSKETYYFGEDVSDLGENAWYGNNSGDQTHEVAEKRPNPNGLYDVSGNVWQWVKDWYADLPPGGTDPKGPSFGSYRVLRGGSCGSVARNLRSAWRDWGHPDHWNRYLGFRPLRTDQ